MSGNHLIETPASELFEVFNSKGLTLAVAESCTGGLISKTITDVPGASSFFIGGVITYHNDLKHELLDVSRETLEKYGAVSRDCALEMATGVRELTGADVGISATGIAGPSGGTPTKPVGLVYVACSSDGTSKARELHLQGGRLDVRRQTMRAALILVLEVVGR